jgi:hypothetical protein
VTVLRTDAYDEIRQDAIAGIERRRLQPDHQVTEVRTEVERAVEAYQHRARLGEGVPLGDERAMTRRVLRSITDLGPLTALLARRDVEEIFVEGARVTYLDTAGRLRGLPEPTTEDENRQILDRLLAETERQLNAKHPLVQARVLDGTARLTAAIPPIADRLSATVRRSSPANRARARRRWPRRCSRRVPRITASVAARRSASSPRRSRTAGTTRFVRPGSTGPGRSRCATSSSSR